MIGGARRGAGRKIAHPDGRTVPVAASVPEGLAKRLMVVAESKNWNRSRAVTEAIRLLLKCHEQNLVEDTSPPSGKMDVVMKLVFENGLVATITAKDGGELVEVLSILSQDSLKVSPCAE